MAALAKECSTGHGRFTIALSGGSTPRRLYQVLASPPYSKEMAWDRWQVFWSDERCVPPDHRDSNYRMAREELLDHLAIPDTNVHRITFTLPLINAAKVVAFLDTDKTKAVVLRQVLEPATGEDMPPAGLVRPSPGEVHWFLTTAAAGRLRATQV